MGNYFKITGFKESWHYFFLMNINDPAVNG